MYGERQLYRVQHGHAVFLLLQGPHMGIGATPFEQFSMRTSLDDATIIQHEDFVGIHHGG